MLDPATRGPAFFALPQDVQAEAYDFPVRFFEPTVHYIRRPGPDPRDVEAAAALIGKSRRPLIIAGGGVHYSGAVDTVRTFAERHGIPVVETVAGKSTLTHDHPNYAGPIGVTGSRAANAVAEQADVVIAVGTRLQDFTTGSWSVFRDPDVRFVASTRPLGCPQAGRPAGRRRCQGRARGYRRGPRRLRRAAGVAGHRRRADRRVARLPRLVVGPPARRAPAYAEVIQTDQRAGRSRRLRPVRRGRPARRAEHGLALEVGRLVRLGVRLLDDGLRDRRRVGRSPGPAGRRCHRVGRRRLVPDDELRTSTRRC